jgi:murein L,D-transpeptidase YcbB/YkuD
LKERDETGIYRGQAEVEGPTATSSEHEQDGTVIKGNLRIAGISAAAMILAAAAPAFAAQPSGGPAPGPRPVAPVPVTPGTVPTAPGANPQVPTVLAPAPITETVMAWTAADAQALLDVIEGLDAEGLFPADYRPAQLRAALAAGEGSALDEAASKSFAWLAEDLRDGRTPMTARVQWFAVDPDQDENPTAAIMAKALSTHDVAGVLASLAPTHPDYAALKAALAETTPAQKARRAAIRANMDRWRWLQRDLGNLYLMTNVPEFQLRLTKNNEIIKTYKTVVGKPGRTATPQLAETVEAVVFNPTWTVPQSIVVGEGLGASLLRSPRAGYKVTKGANGTLTVVQQPGPNNSLGVMKIDMPNPHAIYLHDTPSKQYFNMPVRAYSHGCVRTERALELGMTLAIFGAGLDTNAVVANATSGKYTRVVMTKTVPIYITYFTMGTSIAGQLASFNDIYGRDAPVLASFNQPRQLKTTQRQSNEAIIKLDNPL